MPKDKGFIGTDYKPRVFSRDLVNWDLRHEGFFMGLGHAID